MTERHTFESANNLGAPECYVCGELWSDAIHLRPGETCPDCGNELETHSADHPCPAPSYIDPEE